MYLPIIDAICFRFDVDKVGNKGYKDQDKDQEKVERVKTM